MRFRCVYPNAWKTHVAQLAMYMLSLDVLSITYYQVKRPEIYTTGYHVQA